MHVKCSQSTLVGKAEYIILEKVVLQFNCIYFLRFSLEGPRIFLEMTEDKE